MNSITITRLYEQLSSKLGREAAENLITFIEHKVLEEILDNDTILTGRQDTEVIISNKKSGADKWIDMPFLWFVFIAQITEIIILSILIWLHWRGQGHVF